MRSRIAIYALSSVAAVGMLLGCLALWLYLPASGTSSHQIAQALLDYQSVTATNGRGALGTELPPCLMLYNNSNPSRASGPDFAESGYSYHRFGTYFDRRFDLKRDLPGGNTWTLTTTVGMCPPLWITQREIWWTQRLMTISNGPSALPGDSSGSNAIPSDLMIGRSLPGTWHATAYAEENGWNETLQIATNGEFSSIGYFATDKDGSAESGKVKVENGFLLMTITDLTTPIPAIRRPNRPYTLKLRVFYADSHRILVSFFANNKLLLEKQTP
ncbi:MAG TPA: hypothetical protein VH280_13480 [Verrucomicrobiae bacterium]|jgi:hypothetical protein|nr:hypothetical protein [Verrucomicrobiae bacterium]